MITDDESYKSRRRDMLKYTAQARAHKAQAEAYAWTARAASLGGDRDRAAMYTRMSNEYEGFAAEYARLARKVADELEEVKQANAAEVVRSTTLRIWG